MNNLEKITANRQLCEKLVDLGVEPKAFFWHLSEEDEEAPTDSEITVKWDVCILASPEPFPDVCVPAWTKTEIDVMLGPSFPKPDLFTKEEIGSSRAQDAETYPVFFWGSLKVYKNGADASAEVLIALIDKKMVTVDSINYRYKKVFS